MKIILPADKAIDTEIDLGVTMALFSPARLNGGMPGLDSEFAHTLVDAK
jgi:hypothetical protein